MQFNTIVLSLVNITWLGHRYACAHLVLSQRSTSWSGSGNRQRQTLGCKVITLPLLSRFERMASPGHDPPPATDPPTSSGTSSAPPAMTISPSLDSLRLIVQQEIRTALAGTLPSASGTPPPPRAGATTTGGRPAVSHEAPRPLISAHGCRPNPAGVARPPQR